jgi:hypothetical protein
MNPNLQNGSPARLLPSQAAPQPETKASKIMQKQSQRKPQVSSAVKQHPPKPPGQFSGLEVQGRKKPVPPKVVIPAKTQGIPKAPPDNVIPLPEQ